MEIGRRTRFNVTVRSAGRGSLKIGLGNTFGWKSAPRLGSGEILLQPRAVASTVIIGDRNAFSNNVSLCAMGEISIGNDCLLGDQVAIYDCDFHELDPQYRNRSAGPVLPVVIGNNVWLASRVMVLKGVSIGDNTVVAAGAVVTKSLPANVMAAGVPAKIIRKISL
jgi:maltose O-acetyltransferase